MERHILCEQIRSEDTSRERVERTKHKSAGFGYLQLSSLLILGIGLYLLCGATFSDRKVRSCSTIFESCRDWLP